TKKFTDVAGGKVDWSFRHNNFVSQGATVDMDFTLSLHDALAICYEGVYDGNAYGATLVSATGVHGDDLSGSVTVGPEEFTDVPGGEVDWSFENINYVSQEGTVDIDITQAVATIVVDGYEGVYDGNAYGATLASATGVHGDDLSGSVTVGLEE